MKIVSRYRDGWFQVGENESNVQNLNRTTWQSNKLNAHFFIYIYFSSPNWSSNVLSCHFTKWQFTTSKWQFRPLCFFLCFRWARALDLGRAFLPSARIRLLPIFGKKQLISGDKKIFSIKTSSFREIKSIFPAMFFLLVFFVSLFFKWVKSFFILSLSLTFPEIWPMFFLFGRPH